MHLWHDVPVDEERIADHFPAIIEVPIVDVRAIGVMNMQDHKGGTTSCLR